MLGAVGERNRFFLLDLKKKQAKILLCTKTIWRGVTPDPSQALAPFISGLNPACSHVLQHALRMFSRMEALLEDFAASLG